MLFPRFETLLAEMVEPHLLRVTLNRPQAANALNTQMGRDMLDLCTQIGREPGEVRCIILTGAGERAFCAGGDLKERHGMSDAAWRTQHAIFEHAFWSLMELPVPVIAQVNGAAYGGGLEFVLACDFAYAASDARFALTEVTLGIMPGCGGTQNLARAAGERLAKELILTGRPFGADEAYASGIVNRVLPREALAAAVLDTARAIVANAPLAVRQAKKAIHYGLQADLRTGLRYEVEAYDRLIGTEDRQEGIRAFNEKRPPRYTGQ